MKKSFKRSKTTSPVEPIENRWQHLLLDAVNQPGKMLKAYQAFWHYSIGNQLLALFQCDGRGIEPGAINTYSGWLAVGRQVKKGEKALELCVPVTVKRESKTEENEISTFFVFRRNWFVFAQTEGEAVEFAGTPTWNKEKALQTLGIEEIRFEETNGNVQGYAALNKIAVSPFAALSHKTTMHELAHVVLGHTAELSLQDDERTPKNLREVEAESVALLLCETLELPGAEYARGYIQAWLGADACEIPDLSARRIVHAADKILKAGELTETASHIN